MRKLVILVALPMAVGGCEKQKDYDTQIQALEDRVKKVEDQQGWQSATSEMNSTAFLRTSETSYSMTRADFGNVAVSVENVSEYADGSKITLRIGNTTSATVMGLKAKIDWGKTKADGSVDQDSERSKDEDFTDDLPASSWKNYQVILPGTPPSKIGYIRVSNISHSKISLFSR